MNAKVALLPKNQSHLVVLASPDAGRLVSLGQDHHWTFNVLGQAPLPTRSVRVGEWLLVPAQDDTSSIPIRTLERVKSIYTEGIEPAGFVIVHEAPHQLGAPVKQNEHRTWSIKLSPEVRSALAALAKGAVGVAAVGALALAATTIVALPAVLLVGAAVLDPILVAVTKDGYWIEIDRWVTS